MAGSPGESTCNVCTTTFSTAVAQLFVKDGHSIVRCPTCGLAFRSTLPSRDELDEIYGAAYFGGREADGGRDGYLDYLADEDVHRVNARRRLELLSGFGEPGALLDVGCAAGFFVDEALRHGWDARGIDVSAAMVDWARRHTAADVRLGTFDDAPFEREESCITMWDYIEHALDPHSDISEAFDRLRPGGILALSTGDANAALARLSLKHWHLMTPHHHNYFFSERSIRRLLERSGFDVLSVRHRPSLFPLRYLAHKACLTLRLSLIDAMARRLARSALGARTVPVNLWDVMTVVARRPRVSGDTA